MMFVIVSVINNIIHSQLEVDKPGSECPLGYLLDIVYISNLPYCHLKANRGNLDAFMNCKLV